MHLLSWGLQLGPCDLDDKRQTNERDEQLMHSTQEPLAMRDPKGGQGLGFYSILMKGQ